MVLNMPDNDVIHIALAFCDPKGTYARHAAVTMASIFANAHNRRICVHILHDATLTHDNLFALTELAEKYHQNVAFTDVEKCFEELQNKAKDLPLGGYRGTMFRLFISDVLDVEKVIYLDCDIVVELDIAELWNIHLNGNTVAAVRDVWTLDYLKGKKVPWRLGKVWDLLGVPHDSYFNAGVMVLDLKNIRTKYCLTDKVVEFYSRYRKCITLHDQDFLNWVFAGDVRLIDERFNHINLPSETEKNIYGSIWHMAGGSAKPWNSYSRPYIDDLYWKYLRLTPYCKDDDEFLHLLLMGMGSSPLMHLHSSSCFSRLFKQLKDNVFRAHIWTILPILWQLFKRRLGFVLNRRERYD
jgi:lipopolysaccharide biosynthesis glycosyltransferase